MIVYDIPPLTEFPLWRLSGAGFLCSQDSDKKTGGADIMTLEQARGFVSGCRPDAV